MTVCARPNVETGAVKAGLTTAETVATAFRRLFAARIKLGMLDPPQSVKYNNISFDVCASPAHIALARKVSISPNPLNPHRILTESSPACQAARKAMALHQNRGAALPLEPKTLTADGTLALIGPTADNANNLLGNYAAAATSGPGLAVSLLEGLQVRPAPRSLLVPNRE